MLRSRPESQKVAASGETGIQEDRLDQQVSCRCGVSMPPQEKSKIQRTTCLHKQVECAWIAFRRGNDRFVFVWDRDRRIARLQQNDSYGPQPVEGTKSGSYI